MVKAVRLAIPAFITAVVLVFGSTAAQAATRSSSDRWGTW
jgi:hypothetical protein